MTTDQLKALVRDVPNFPEEGILFKDLMPLIGDGKAFHASIRLLAEWARSREPDVILGAEARGLILRAAIATEAPCSASMRAVAAPIPELAPLTKATLPWSAAVTTSLLCSGWARA